MKQLTQESPNSYSFKVLCIHSAHVYSSHRISYGKYYSAVNSNDTDDFYYTIVTDDIGSTSICPKFWFSTLSEVRQEKLNKLGIE